MTKQEAWRQWWNELRKTVPAGSYNPMEARMYDAWEAAWDAAVKVCCNGDCKQGRECPARK
jgi:hypothetical protein